MRRNGLDKNRPVARAVFSLMALVAVTACVSPEPLNLSHFRSQTGTPRRFSVCHGYGCAYESRVRLSAGEWQQARQPLITKAGSAEEERRQIGTALALIEQLVGKKTGTATDAAGASIFGHNAYQMDCIDETVNTSLYLQFLEKDGLITWHRVAAPLRRGDLIDGEWPHNTAAIIEKATGKQYAVDSWFFENGTPPAIIPAELWLTGWRP
jgi:hypothetical protein